MSTEITYFILQRTISIRKGKTKYAFLILYEKITLIKLVF